METTWLNNRLLLIQARLDVEPDPKLVKIRDKLLRFYEQLEGRPFLIVQCETEDPFATCRSRLHNIHLTGQMEHLLDNSGD